MFFLFFSQKQMDQISQAAADSISGHGPGSFGSGEGGAGGYRSSKRSVTHGDRILYDSAG